MILAQFDHFIYNSIAIPILIAYFTEAIKPSILFLPFFPKSRQSLAIDLGNNNTLIANKDSILSSQPSWIAFNTANRSIKAVGDEAFKFDGKNNNTVKTIKPLRGGVIADHDSARLMMQEIVKHAFPKKKNWIGFENVISGVPLHTTSVERHAFMDALEQFPTGKRHLIVEPIAAAIGLGLNIHEPQAKLIMDIGGGITEIVVISLSGIATYNSLRIGGDTMDESIQAYFRRRYNLAIGSKTAERIKQDVGAVSFQLNHAPSPIQVEGKDLMSGLPAMRLIGHEEIAEVLESSILLIEECLMKTLEECSPELAGDLIRSGIHLTGGCSQLRGLRHRLEKLTHLSVHSDPDPFNAVGKGISRVMRNPEHYKSLLIN